MSMTLLPQADFAEITRLIVAARSRAVQPVNTKLINLYWQVGQTISQKIAQAQWGDGVVAQLAGHLAQTQPGLRGFTRPNLFRMRQFKTALFERRVLHPAKASPLVSQMQPDALSIFKDSYLVEFLGLPQGHAEAARASRHWRAVVCPQRRRGGGTRAKPQPVASADCAIPDPVARQGALAGQVARVFLQSVLSYDATL